MTIFLGGNSNAECNPASFWRDGQKHQRSSKNDRRNPEREKGRKGRNHRSCSVGLEPCQCPASWMRCADYPEEGCKHQRKLQSHLYRTFRWNWSNRNTVLKTPNPTWNPGGVFFCQNLKLYIEKIVCQIYNIYERVMNMENKEYGLVLSGGGTRGAFQIGVWKALEELGIKIKW